MKLTPFLVVAVVLLAGCSGLVFPGDKTESTPTPTETPGNTVDAPAATQTTTTSATETTGTSEAELNKSQKYFAFTYKFNQTFPHDLVTVTRLTVDAPNDTMKVSYEIQDVNNSTEIKSNRELVMGRYLAVVRFYTQDNNKRSKAWVPKRLMLESWRADTGERYATGWTNYTVAKRHSDAEIPYHEYIQSYYDTVEYGPGAPEIRQ